MDNNKLNKLGELLEDKELLAKFNGVDKETALKMLAENGLELSSEEFDEIGKMVSSSGEELSSDELDKVAGGLSWKKYWSGLMSTLKGFWDGICGK